MLGSKKSALQLMNLDNNIIGDEKSGKSHCVTEYHTVCSTVPLVLNSTGDMRWCDVMYTVYRCSQYADRCSHTAPNNIAWYPLSKLPY